MRILYAVFLLFICNYSAHCEKVKRYFSVDNPPFCRYTYFKEANCMESKKKRFTLVIPEDIHAELVKEAESRYQSLQGFIMSVLTDYLKSKKGE